MEAPADGAVIVEVGAVWSVDAVPATRPEMSVVGCAPMSASTLTVTCCATGSGVFAGTSPSWWESRPQAHWTLPALNTRPPALYIVRLLQARLEPVSDSM